MNKYIISLTTIPSKFNKIDIVINSLINQSIKPEKIIINIPKIYSFRFNNEQINNEKMNEFINKYSKYNVFINFIDTDFGPGTKLLGLFNYLDVNVDNTYIVLVDDDAVYKKYMLEHFDKESSNVEVGSYCVDRYNTLKIGKGVDGFFIKSNTLIHFLEYYNQIKEEDYVNYHDDFYISYYFHLIKKDIHFIKPPYGQLIYNLTDTRLLDALHLLKCKYNRNNLNVEIYKILTNFEKEGKFNFMFSFNKN